MMSARNDRTPSPIRRATAALSDSPVLRGAAYLYASTITTSALGFVFWFVAAKMLAPAAVGRASAAQAAAQLIATIGILGLGTLTIAELSSDKRQVRRLVSAACIVAATASATAALVTGAVLGHVSVHLAPVLTGPADLICFTLLAGTVAAGLVIDDACVGFLRGYIQLTRNTVFAAVKLMLLPLAIYAWDTSSGEQIVLVWLIAMVLSVGLAIRLIAQAPADPSWRPDFANLIEKRGLIWSHHLLNVAVLAPQLVAPLVVTAVVGPAANAGYYTAALMTSFVNIIPGQLSMALFAITPGDEQALAREARKTMRLCVALAIASALVFSFGSHPILYVFRRSYVSADHAMALLGLCTIFFAVKAHYVAIARVHGRMRRAARLAALGATLEVSGIVVGASLAGVTGTAGGLLAAYFVEAILFAPTVVAALRGRGGDNP